VKCAVNHFNDSELSRWILGLDARDHLSMPGKLMGLASFGQPDPAATSWLARRGWLQEAHGTRDEVLADLRRDLPHLGVESFSTCDRGCQILAACLQRHLEEEVLAYIRHFRALTGAPRLYLSGGAALNIHANTRIERELGFESVCIPPAPSDAGLALGAAAFVEWWSGHPTAVHSPFLNRPGPEPTRTPSHGFVPVVRSVAEAAEAIAAGKVVGVWTGDAEVGPRALGHRSLLARPDSLTMRRRLSEEMKRREWYRPVAPMMLAEVARDALAGFREGSTLGRYMLGAWPLAPGWEDAFAGCVHADGTVRAQVVEEHAPGLDHMRRLLGLLRGSHDVQGVINTSFNARGEPIVGRLSEAVRTAQELGLDALWVPGDLR
jgi:carbamoyltransferase